MFTEKNYGIAGGKLIPNNQYIGVGQNQVKQKTSVEDRKNSKAI